MPEDPVAPLVADFARYRADEPLRLSDYDTSDTADVDHDEAQRELASLVERIAELQARLYAQESRAVLVVLQASTYEDVLVVRVKGLIEEDDGQRRARAPSLNAYQEADEDAVD